MEKRNGGVEAMMKAGTMLYTNKLKAGTKNGDLQLTLKGNAIVLLLGYVDRGVKDPEPSEMWSLIGEVGLVGFDHVEECLGKESKEKLMKFFGEKFK